ncbi:hypothetical protein ID866_2974 [Astraeus odoratus]|nr:hypothetical protein ID866_2974 [Astraeus odoratus]
MIAPLPTHGTHGRTASREEDIIWSLRTQLAFQQELCTQYEIDLGARDEMVQALTGRLDTAEKENEKRKNILRTWKKKAAELEKMCRSLEDEVDNSRQESLERSVMDEATGEALRQLHRQISHLEREKGDVETKEVTLRNERDTLTVALKEREEEIAKLREDLRSQADDELVAKEHFRKAEEQDQEIASLREEIRTLENKISGMEEDWSEGENKKHALEATLQEALELRVTLETERDELDEQLHRERDHADGLTQALQEQEDRISDLDDELRFTKESVARLEENVKMRNEEITSLSERLLQSAKDAEELREQLSSLHREQARIREQQRREVDDALTREEQAREQLEEALKEKAKSDIMLGSSKERIDSLTEEVTRLRGQVHQLQLESADKEVKILQLTKQHMQDKEDINGLNIALDSKQQELELVKRRVGVRGAGTGTPASTSKASRRDSTVISTPSFPPRPPSALSDVSRDGSERRLTGTPSTAPRASIVALNKSIRSNTTATSISGTKPAGSMGPPAKVSRPISATPTPPVRSQSALGRSSGTRPSLPGTPSDTGSLRRASVSGSVPQIKTPIRRPSAGSTSASADEKENLSLTPNALKTPRRPAHPA